MWFSSKVNDVRIHRHIHQTDCSTWTTKMVGNKIGTKSIIQVQGTKTVANTRKNVLDRGSRSDRPRYCVTTPIRAGHWPLILTYDLAFQFQTSYDHDPHTQTEVQRSVISNGGWKQTDWQTATTDCYIFLAKAVGNTGLFICNDHTGSNITMPR